MRGAPLDSPYPVLVRFGVLWLRRDRWNFTDKVHCLCTCRGGREVSQPGFHCVSSLTPALCLSLSLAGLGGCSGAECDSSPRAVLCDSRALSPLWQAAFLSPLYSHLMVILVFKFLPLTCHPCLSCLFISVCTALPPRVYSAPSCGAWADILVFAGKTLFWVVGVFVPCLFPAVITVHCSDRAGFSSSCHAPLVCTPCMFIWELCSFTQSPESNCRFQFVVWKIVCSLENGGFSAFSSS